MSSPGGDAPQREWFAEIAQDPHADLLESDRLVVGVDEGRVGHKHLAGHSGARDVGGHVDGATDVVAGAVQHRSGIDPAPPPPPESSSRRGSTLRQTADLTGRNLWVPKTRPAC
jgi:hypothetical protein